MGGARPRSRGRRRLLAALAAAALLGPLGWMWQDSLQPGTYSVMDMGYPDTGGAERASPAWGHGAHAGHGRDITTLIADPTRPPDVSVALFARQERFALSSGRAVDGFTLNGASPGPTIRATVGQLVAVRLVNLSVRDGVSLHWHGLDVPAAEDGVAGVTQDAVRPGGEHAYRFVVDQPGTYWYHSHQHSTDQVRGGLLGALVVVPLPGLDVDVDQVALVHHYGGVAAVNGHDGDLPVQAPPGSRVRVRVVNADSGPMWVWVAGAPYRLAAVDGRELHEPAPVRDEAVRVPAGGRADVEVSMPDDGSPVRVHLGGRSGVLLGTASRTPAPAPRPARTLDLLRYGTPAPLGLDPERPDRSFDYVIGRRPGFLDGRPGLWWTVNGHIYPDVPMYVVAEGDVVRMRIVNRSGDLHPMHLHGHHAVVLARDGVPANGSPWWVDSLDVADGETYELAFVADNPGIWLDHCHNLPHAQQGLLVHLAYEGVTTPFVIGGPAGNRPE